MGSALLITNVVTILFRLFDSYSIYHCKQFVLIFLVQVMNRLRFGIGRPASHGDASSYVLDDFDATEVPLLLSTINNCIEMLVKQYNLVEQVDREQKDDRTKG